MRLWFSLLVSNAIPDSKQTLENPHRMGLLAWKATGLLRGGSGYDSQQNVTM